ncbi:hypothetical protein [Aminirod propionatiphilus]|uniref:hypothetical protein n=1 Tax=Aminirod propionatiphilus TaxID=3415223 RepID=UPI003BFA7896
MKVWKSRRRSRKRPASIVEEGAKKGKEREEKEEGLARKRGFSPLPIEGRRDKMRKLIYLSKNL